MTIDLSIVVPIYNEDEVLWMIAEKLSEHLDKIIQKDRWQYILVDNGSIDSTPQIIQQIKQRWPNTISIRLKKPDIGKAQAAGLKQAKCEWAYLIQIDWWDPVFLKWAWIHRHSYDLIFGSKRADNTLNQHSRYRKILSWGLNTILQFYFGFIGTDTHGDKLLNMTTMRPIIENCVMHKGQFDTEFMIRAMRKGLWLAEVPIPILELRKRRNWMIRKILQNVWDIFFLWRVIKKVPFSHSLRYHRWAREDLLNESASVFKYKGVSE